MKAVIQRVSQAAVMVEHRVVGEIGSGLLVLLGVAAGDSEVEGKLLAAKICDLRILNDGSDRMNLSLKETGGAALVVSQFTLLADTRKGRRPSYVAAAPPEMARGLYERFIDQLKDEGVPTAAGVFGASMQVSLVNDGPVTILLDTEDLRSPRRSS